MPTSWTNDPVTTSVPIRALHITELRNAINASRSALHLSGYPFTDHTIAPGATPIRAVHFGEIRRAIQDLWNRKRMGSLPSWRAGSPPSPSRTIRADDMNDLRQWMNAYESNQSLVDPQGVVSFIFDPGGPYEIDDDFIDDVQDLKPEGRKLLIRANVIADSDNDIESYYDDYNRNIERWTSRGFDIALVLTHELDRYDKIDPDDQELYWPNHNFTGPVGSRLNPYILHFAERCGNLAYALRNSGCTSYWIWNEPQGDGRVSPGEHSQHDDPGTIAPEIFRALLLRVCESMRSRVSDLRLYTGSLQILHNSSSESADRAGIDQQAAWLNDMYRWVTTTGGTLVTPSLLWNAVSINAEGLFGDDHADYAEQALTGVMNDSRYNDWSPIIVGEWGSVNSICISRDSDSGQCNEYRDVTLSEAVQTFQALQRFPYLYFFQHPSLNRDQYQGDNDYGCRNYDYRSVGGIEYFHVTDRWPWYYFLRDHIYPSVEE
jgi:hypothetical protein